MPAFPADTTVPEALAVALARQGDSFTPRVKVALGDLILTGAVVEVEADAAVSSLQLADHTRELTREAVRPLEAGAALLAAMLDAALEVESPAGVHDALQAERNRLLPARDATPVEDPSLPADPALLPLDGAGGLTGDVIEHAVNVLDLVTDTVRNAFEHLGRESEPVGGHGVLRGDRAQ